MRTEDPADEIGTDPEAKVLTVGSEEDPEVAREPEPPTHAGYVTLVGRPNAGKSTLLNRMVGQKLSIVTSKAQTTWERVTGIDTRDGVQMIFLDTPGLLEVKDLLQRSMLGAALEALREADVVLLVLDATRSMDESTGATVRDALAETRAPLIAAVNKIDEAPREHVDALAGWAETELGARVFRISAMDGTNVAELRAALEEALPRGPFLYPEDEVASQPVRFFVSELVRETVFEQFRQEIPYSVFCQIDEFRENQEPVYIGATLFVERESQKQIVIGKKGSAIRELGRSAREKIEHFIGEPVYLDLWVKALPGWRRNRSDLARLGFHVPGDDDAEA